MSAALLSSWEIRALAQHRRNLDRLEDCQRLIRKYRRIPWRWLPVTPGNVATLQEAVDRLSATDADLVRELCERGLAFRV